MDKKNYYLEFVKQYKEIRKNEDDKPKLLLHVCCAPCSCYPLMFLNDLFDITILFTNSNIYPLDEYNKRLETLKKFISDFNITYKSDIGIIEDNYDYLNFKEDLLLYKDLKEGLQRCQICIKKRMIRLFEVAKEKDFKYVSTVMSISRNKDANYINEINKSLEKEYPGITYIYNDFKKNNGQDIGIEISKKFNLYRQSYCGCEFSLINKNKSLINYEIGVIVNSHHNETSLQKCLDSLIYQDSKVPYIIYLLLDNPSEEEIFIGNKFYENYPEKIKVIINSFNDRSENLNFGIKNIPSKYVVFINAEDFVTSNYLSILYKSITEENSDIVTFNYFINKRNRFKKQLSFVNILNFNRMNNLKIARYLFLGLFLKEKSFNKMIRKDLLITNNIFFLPFSKHNEDFFFSFECYLATNKLKFIKDNLYFYNPRINSNHENVFIDQLNLINSYFLCKFYAFKNNKKDSVDTQLIIERIIFFIKALRYHHQLDVSLSVYLKRINGLFNKLSTDNYIYEGEEWEKGIFLYEEMYKEILKG